MKKEEYTELMHLSLDGELNRADQAVLDTYLKKHPDAKKEYQELKKFNSFITQNVINTSSASILDDVRRDLRKALRNQRKSRSLFARVDDLIGDFFQRKFAFAGIGMLLMGLLIGYFSFSQTGKEGEIAFQTVSGSTDTSPRTSITNIRFIDSDGSDGEIEFEFDAVAPMHLKGKIDDPEVQKILTHALLNESNAGVRLSTVNAIRDHSENGRLADPSIKSALILSLKTDMNPGVRKEALRVLQQYTFDNEIRDALLFVISKDANSGIRVAAINALEIAKMEGTKFDEATINALKQQMNNEQNNYIRNRAANLVKEIYQ